MNTKKIFLSLLLISLVSSLTVIQDSPQLTDLDKKELEILNEMNPIQQNILNLADSEANSNNLTKLNGDKNHIYWSMCLEKGLAYNRFRHLSNYSVDQFGCIGCTEQIPVNTYCYEHLPLLCIDKGGYHRPPYYATTPVNDFAWSEGMIKSTFPIMGCQIPNSHTADFICQHLFGPRFKMLRDWDASIVTGLAGENNSYYDWADNNPKIPVFGRAWSYGAVDTTGGNKFWVHSTKNGMNCWATSPE